jgi:hypothetical protein
MELENNFELWNKVCFQRAYIMKTIFVLALFIFFMSANISTASEEDDFLNIFNDYKTFDRVSVLNEKNSRLGAGPGGNMATAGGPYFTVYMLFRGWPAMQCESGKNPTTSRCFVEEGIDINNTFLYNVGIKDKARGTSAFSRIIKKRFDVNNESTTLLLLINVSWFHVECSDSKDGSSDCDRTKGFWENWLWQTIPTPQNITYNKTHTIALTNYSWGTTVNTSLTQEKLGFALIGNASVCSVEIPRNPFENIDCSKNKTISAEISKILPYFRVAFDGNRQLYYGELLNPPMPPYVNYTSIVLIPNNESGQVEQILLPAGGAIDKAYVITPFGKKLVNLSINEKIEESNTSQIITLWLMIVLFFAAFRLMLKGG